MRAFWIGLALAALSARIASAIPYFPPPQPVYEAPIDRALDNVANMEGVEPAQRERLLGRLNLLAYARDDAPFAYLREGDQFNEAGSVACADAPQSMRDPSESQIIFGPDERCAQMNFQLGPRNEIPEGPPATPSAAALARLERAEAHYARAIALDGKDLRARLGHAYTLDRLGRLSDARTELRHIIAFGQPRLEPQADWELYTVLTETAAHFDRIATSATDRYRIARLRKRLGQVQPMIYVTPILVPLREAPFAALTDNASNVSFDFAGTGDARAQGWLTPNAAWLVWDPNGRGQVRSGFDMIGARTWAVFWHDGFEAMRALDDDGDGELAGQELTGLALWRDANGDGVSDAGEVLPVSAHGVVGLSTRGEETRPGLLTAPNGVRLQNGDMRPLYDWTPGLAPVS